MTPGEGKKYIGYRRETGLLIIRILVITLEGKSRVEEGEAEVVD